MEKEHENGHSSQEMTKQNDFCIPERCCPDRSPSPQLPSPTSCLPSEVLEKVLEKIREANELLLDLALDERTPDETYQKVFDGLVGLRVAVTNLVEDTIEGRVTLVGFNFVTLCEDENISIVPYSQIETIKPYGRFAEPYHDPELSEIDPCFRRDLTFHFGAVVSSSPELIQLFFRINLTIYLLLFVDKRIKITIDDTTFDGIITKVDKESIDLKVDEGSTIIPIEKISLITITSQ